MTMDLIMRVNVRTTTTTVAIIVEYACHGNRWSSRGRSSTLLPTYKHGGEGWNWILHEGGGGGFLPNVKSGFVQNRRLFFRVSKELLRRTSNAEEGAIVFFTVAAGCSDASLRRPSTAVK